jgi:hypothetical protein
MIGLSLYVIANAESGLRRDAPGAVAKALKLCRNDRAMGTDKMARSGQK